MRHEDVAGEDDQSVTTLHVALHDPGVDQTPNDLGRTDDDGALYTDGEEPTSQGE